MLGGKTADYKQVEALGFAKGQYIMDRQDGLIRELLAALPDPVFIITENGRYAGVFGGTDPGYYHNGSSLEGASLQDVLPGEKADWFLEQVHRTLREQRLVVVEYGLAGTEIEGIDSHDGPAGELWFEARIQPLSITCDGERAVVWTARNITKRHELEAELRLLSETDALTGVFNRRKLIDRLTQHLQEFQRYGHTAALIMLDIDHFKGINDRYGHLMGDEVLCQVSTTCLQQLRKPDLLARFGGEEFAALLPGTDLNGARLTAERLRQAVARTEMKLTVGTCSVTISIGVSEFLAEDRRIENVIKRTDDALYEAKRQGRNRVAALPE